MDDWRDFVGLLPEGLIIAFVTLLGYGAAYSYWYGFLKFFGISEQFIDLGLISVLSAIFFVVLVNSFLAFSFYLVVRGLPQNGFLLQKYFRNFIVLLCIFYLFAFPTGGMSKFGVYIFTALLSVLYLFLEYMFPSFVIPGVVGGYRCKLVTLEREFPRLVLIVTMAMALLTIDSILPSLFGYLSAQMTTDFLVTNTSPEMVVLYKGGDNLICEPFDRKTKKVHKQFTILRLDKESVPVLSLQKVGPLSVVE